MFENARRLLVSLGLAVTAAIAPVATTAQAAIPYLQSQPRYAAIVVDAKSGEVLYDKRADSPRYPASITKVMTMYLVFEALASGRLRLDDRLVVSPRAAAQAPTKLGLRAGETISVQDAILAMCTKSANDMAVVVAERLGGTESRFAAMMTLRARELGMSNTHFVNASGLPDSRQISTARDLAILSRAVMRDYPQYYGFFGAQNFTYRGVTMRNHNGMLRTMPGVDGIKTGYTNASGFNIAVSAMRDNRRLITVVLGAPSTALRNENAEDLMLTGFSVMTRRDRGEKITIAQSLFEPEPSGPVLRPSVEQGDGEQQQLNIVLASAPPPRAKSAPAGGRYQVQVGAFRSKADAKKQLSFVTKRFGKYFDREDGVVGARSGGSYPARFTGYTQSEAKSACKALKAKKQPCMVVGPA